MSNGGGGAAVAAAEGTAAVVGGTTGDETSFSAPGGAGSAIVPQEHPKFGPACAAPYVTVPPRSSDMCFATDEHVCPRMHDLHHRGHTVALRAAVWLSAWISRQRVMEEYAAMDLRQRAVCDCAMVRGQRLVATAPSVNSAGDGDGNSVGTVDILWSPGPSPGMQPVHSPHDAPDATPGADGSAHANAKGSPYGWHVLQRLVVNPFPTCRGNATGTCRVTSVAWCCDVSDSSGRSSANGYLAVGCTSRARVEPRVPPPTRTSRRGRNGGTGVASGAGVGAGAGSAACDAGGNGDVDRSNALQEHESPALELVAAVVVYAPSGNADAPWLPVARLVAEAWQGPVLDLSWAASTRGFGAATAGADSDADGTGFPLALAACGGSLAVWGVPCGSHADVFVEGEPAPPPPPVSVIAASWCHAATSTAPRLFLSCSLSNDKRHLAVTDGRVVEVRLRVRIVVATVLGLVTHGVCVCVCVCVRAGVAPGECQESRPLGTQAPHVTSSVNRSTPRRHNPCVRNGGQRCRVGELAPATALPAAHHSGWRRPSSQRADGAGCQRPYHSVA